MPVDVSLNALFDYTLNSISKPCFCLTSDGQQRGQYGQQGGYQQQPYQGGYANQSYQAQGYPAQQQYGMQQQQYGQPMYQQQQYQPQSAMYGQPGVPMPPVQASPWRSATAADGQVYYYNQNTGETTWDVSSFAVNIEDYLRY
jgi:hypothetical protein